MVGDGQCHGRGMSYSFYRMLGGAPYLFWMGVETRKSLALIEVQAWTVLPVASHCTNYIISAPKLWYVISDKCPLICLYQLQSNSLNMTALMKFSHIKLSFITRSVGNNFLVSMAVFDELTVAFWISAPSWAAVLNLGGLRTWMGNKLQVYCHKHVTEI
jgi:hypothetical protein